MNAAARTLAVLAALGAVGGAAVVGLGLYNVSAKVGHYPGVSWVLHTTFKQSVRLRAERPEVMPDLSDPDLIALGARHYATACAPCHSTPGAARTATMRAMVPEPPHIEEAVAHWAPHEMHWIVFNGIKMSGMPAWPAEERPEEVWPVVAYLDAVKSGLTGEQQARLTAPGDGDGPDGAAYCNGCHGGIGARVPRLDILGAKYVADTLRDYRTGTRASGIMEQAATVIPEEAVAELAAYYGGMTSSGAASGTGDARGEELATRGTDDVPACSACHGPNATEENARFPSLSGQDRGFLVTQLRLWRDGTRGGSELMEKAALDLTDAEIAALADWFSGLTPEKR